ncbi:MAG: indolepyruvate oxidoreductase subunit beta [Candidatus Caldarchaeum sp.]
MNKVEIIIAGVGGQGTMLAARVLGRAACSAGLKAVGAELLGLSQRGGAVVSHVRIGDDVYSPVVMEGSADILLGFEPSEAVRRLPYVSTKGLIIVNTAPFVPPSVSMGLASYPSLEQLLETLSSHAATVPLNAKELAMRSGNPITLNAVMLGALAATGKLPFSRDVLSKTLAASVPEKLSDVNLKAFNLGYEAYLSAAARTIAGSHARQP